MSDPTDEAVAAPTPFSEFMLEHNRGAQHHRASEALQELVSAVQDTGKKGSLTITVGVEQMKGNADALFTTIDVKTKLPVNPPKAAIFYADDDGRLSRTDPGQLQFPEDVKEAPAAAEPRDVPTGEQAEPRDAGGTPTAVRSIR
jgi:hypothetical protein